MSAIRNHDVHHDNGVMNSLLCLLPTKKQYANQSGTRVKGLAEVKALPPLRYVSRYTYDNADAQVTFPSSVKVVINFFYTYIIVRDSWMLKDNLM